MMLQFILMVLLLLFAVYILWKSSDWVTDSLVPVAHYLGTSYIAVTTLLVSFILSLPEIFVAIYSYLLGNLDVGLGVVVGSVMVNIGLIAGTSAIVRPLNVEKAIVLRDGIFMVIAAGIVLLFGSDLHYSRSEGLVLLLLFIPYALNVWAYEKWRPRKHQQKKVAKVKKNLILIGHNWFKLKPSLLTFIFGGFVLVLGSYLFSFSLVKISDLLPIPSILVGLIFGAIGTGIPNIVAALQGTLKGYDDVAITETFGSNIFTLLITLGLIVVISPFTIPGKVFYYDLTWMIIMNILLIAFIFKGYFYHEKSLVRIEGIVLLLFYLTILIVNLIWF